MYVLVFGNISLLRYIIFMHHVEYLLNAFLCHHHLRLEAMHNVPFIDIKFLGGNVGASVLLLVGILKDLVTACATRLPSDYKNTVILTFHMRKLRPSNLGGVLIPSVIFIIVVRMKMSMK